MIAISLNRKIFLSTNTDTASQCGYGPQKALGKATCGLLLVLPGILLPNLFWPHPTHRRAVRFAFFPNLRVPLRSETLHDHRNSPRGSTPARRLPAPIRCACVRRAVAALLRNPVSCDPVNTTDRGGCAYPTTASGNRSASSTAARDASASGELEMLSALCSAAAPCMTPGRQRTPSRHCASASTVVPHCPQKCGELTQFGIIGRRKSRRKTS
jgi:hypothetical protein